MKENDLSDLRLRAMLEFVEFASYPSASKAAAGMGISQSSLSKHLSQLEAAAGFALFEKGYRLTLTPAGAKLAEGLAQLLSDLDSNLEKCRQIHERGVVELRIESNNMHFAAREIIDNAVSKFLTIHPEVVYRIVPCKTNSVRKSISRNLVDLGFWYDFGEVEEIVKRRRKQGLGLVYLRSEDMVVWAKRDHPILKAERIGASDIAQHRIMSLLPMQSSHRYTIHEELFASKPYERYRPAFDIRAVDQIAEFLMLDPRDSIYLLPESYAKDPIVSARTSMQWRMVDDGSTHHHIFLAYSLSSNSPCTEQFVEFLQMLQQPSAM